MFATTTYLVYTWILRSGPESLAPKKHPKNRPFLGLKLDTESRGLGKWNEKCHPTIWTNSDHLGEDLLEFSWVIGSYRLLLLCICSLKLTAKGPLKNDGKGRQSFPFGFQPIFRGKLLDLRRLNESHSPFWPFRDDLTELLLECSSDRFSLIAHWSGKSKQIRVETWATPSKHPRFFPNRCWH